MNKYLKIAIIVIILSSLALGIYFLLKKNPAIQNLAVSLFPASQKLNNGPIGNTAGTPEQKFQAPINEPIFDYWINSKNGSVYYLNQAGQVIKSSNGSNELVNSQTLPKLNKISASNDGTYAVAEFNYPQLPTFSIFNTVSNNWQALPANTIAAAWSPNLPAGAQELLYADNKNLNVLNLTNQKTAKIIELTQKELGLSWISPETALLYSQLPTAELGSDLWSLNLNTKNLLPIIKNEPGLTIQWSKNSNLGIKLFNQKRKPLISLIDQNGAILDTFNFLTLPSKCLIDKNKIYCAVPKNIREGLNFPDDYYKKSVYFDDAFYLIDLSGAGVKELKTDSDLTIDAEHLEISGGKLFFKNRLDDKLYSLAL